MRREPGQRAYIRKGLVAGLMVADMGLLAGMCARVDSQGAALDEALVAVLDGAVVGPLVRMYSIVSAEV